MAAKMEQTVVSIPASGKASAFALSMAVACLLSMPTPGCAKDHRTELVCQGVQVTLMTRCAESAGEPYPSCQSERLSFRNPKTGKTKVLAGAGVLIRGGERGTTRAKVLDGLVSGWTCARGSKGWYVVVRYDNGGNCKQCEWHEIYTTQGKWLTRGTRADPRIFARVYRRLGIPTHLDPPLTDRHWTATGTRLGFLRGWA